MLLTKLKTVVALLVMLGVVTLTCGMLTGKGDAPDSLASEGKKESARVSLDQKDKAVREELRLLQGTWRCVGLDLGGERVEGKRYTERYGPNPILISGNKLSVAIGKKRIDCTFVIDPTRTPKWIDSKREPDGLALFGIYEFEDGRLKLYDSGGKRPTEFRTKKGTTEVFHIYERDTRADALSRERKKFVGTWRVISSEVNGKELREGDFEGIVVCDAEGRWKQQTGDGTTLAEGTSEIDLTANPRAIHFTVTSKGADKGKTIRKVYEFTGEDALRWSPYPSEKDRPTVFPPKPGPQRSLDVLERVKKQPATSHPKIPPKEAPARAPTPGSYTGAGLVMMIDANGVVSYPNTPGPVICHLELTADGGLKAEFPDKKLGRGKWDPVTLKLSSKEKWVVWTTVVKGDTYKVTAMPYSPEAYLFELEIRSDGKLVAGALQFYAICEPRPREK